jgi:hypothetical protein
MISTFQAAIFLFIIVLLIHVYSEKYSLLSRHYSLDSQWNVRSSNRKKDSFNTCSPESYEECAKVAMPHLSRY